MDRSQAVRLARPFAAFLLFAVGLPFAAHGQSILTVAGGGTDDGRPATEVQLVSPFGVAVDASGNLFLADYGTNRVRVVDAATGRIRTVAGNGVGTFAGDGGPGPLASLYHPTSLAFDGRGGLLIADGMNFRIRRVDLASKTISTLIGGGTVSGSVDQVPATSTQTGWLAGLTVDGAGNVLFSESGEDRVRLYDAASGIVSFVISGQRGFSGDGGPARAAAFNSPRGLAFDMTGNLFIADQWNQRVRRIDAKSGIVTTVAGNGTRARPTEGALATDTGFDQPLGVAVERDGSLLVRDVSGLYRISATTGRISRVFDGTGFDSPVVLPSGRIVVSTSSSQTVRRLDPSGGGDVALAGGGVGGLGDGGPATSAFLPHPTSAVLGPTGDLFIAEFNGHRIRRVSSGVVSTFAGTGIPGAARDGDPRSTAQLNSPFSLAVDRAGNLFVSDFSGSVLRIDATTGKVATIPSFGNSRLAVDARDQLYVADTYVHRISRVDPTTRQVTLVAGNGTHGFSGDGGPATLASLADPQGIAFDSAGNLYVADSSNYRIRKVDAVSGTISTVAGGGTRRDLPVPALEADLGAPYAVAADGRGGLLISGGLRITRLVLSTGVLEFFAGRTGNGSTGDGGPLSAASFSSVRDLFYDSRGNLLLPDADSNLVRSSLACVTVGPPTLFSPADGETGTATGPALSWSPVAGAFRYAVHLGTSSPPTTTVATDLAATSFSPLNLLPATRHYWRVVAKGDPFCVPPSSAVSVVRSFTTASGCAPPATPVPVSPADGALSVAAPVTLSWQPVPGAESYDVFLGATNPPPLLAFGGTGTSITPINFHPVPGATYYWSIVAHAACDPLRTSASAVRSFRVAGSGCPAPASFLASAPADGETGLAHDVLLEWTASPNATSYDVYLGTGSSPSLYRPGVSSTSLVLGGLSPGATYRWKVVALTSCDAGATAATAVRSFTVRGTCSTPGSTGFTFLPPGSVATGQTYVVSWSAAADLDAGGGYVVERSTSSSFAPILDVARTTGLFASFIAPAAGSLHHRVRAIPACDPAKVGPWSTAGVVSVVSSKPNVVFSRAPDSVVVGVGERLEDRKSVFALENVTSIPVQVIVARQELSSVPFFTIVDPSGGDAGFVTLEPRVPKLFEVRFSGPGTETPGSYQGLVVVVSTGTPLTVTPYAFVSLKVGSSPDATPGFRSNGVATEYAAFPGFSGDDSDRPPISVDVHNPGASPLELAAEVGPEVWLALEPGWNASPIPPGGTRTLRLFTRRTRAPNGSALPRYTYLTLRTKGGTTSRLLVQDNDAPLLSSGRGASAVRPDASFLVPSVAHVTSALGNTFVSRLSLSNASTEAVQAELVFTPASSETSLVDGFDPAATKRATVVVPPNDLVRLSDPLVLLFGLTPPISGTLEVRAPSARAGFLSVSSSVDAPSPTGGTFGFGMPVFRSGEGLRAGGTAALAAVASDAAERTNLILAETTGVDSVVAMVTLYDRDGAFVGEERVQVPRWGQRQLSGVVPRLGGASGSRAGRLEISVESRGGTLAAVTTVVDNANDDAASFVAKGAPATSAARALSPAWARATGTVKYLVPALVNGYQTFPSSAAPFTFRSVMGFTSLSTADALFRMTYYDLASGATIYREVRVPARKTIEHANVLEQLFGIAAGAASQGPLFVESDPNGLLWCRVASSLESGTIGDSFPVVPIPSDGLTGGSVARMISIDGLEQSVDRTRGTRSNLLLNEVAGKPVTLVVSLYEAGNRTSPIAERELRVGPLEKVQLSTVFAELGLDSEERRKDRTNVLCTVRAKEGEGMASAVVTTIDNRTGDTRNIALAPNGSGTGGGTIGF